MRAFAVAVVVGLFGVLPAQAACIGNSPIGCGMNGPWDYHPGQQAVPTYPQPQQPQTWTGTQYGNSTYWNSNNGQHLNCYQYGYNTYCR